MKEDMIGVLVGEGGHDWSVSRCGKSIPCGVVLLRAVRCCHLRCK